ncbi:MAG TPA: class I SAM-dependent methyltransferase [Chloroflexota bacterium]|nr:class I SAM-dependent methyltransferase [Chloroflexota bacterium]
MISGGSPISVVPKPVSAGRAIHYRCPACERPIPWSASVLPDAWRLGGTLPSGEQEGLFGCPGCHAVYSLLHGLPCLMVDGDLRDAEPFLHHYEAVRDGEGMGLPLETVRWLPELPPHTYPRHLAALWRRRRQAYARLLGVVRQHGPDEDAGLNIVELGAGTGWLSWRLHNLGHQVVATDICPSPRHGLGMALRLPMTPPSGREQPRFICVQASMDRLPFPDQQFDIAVAAASLHYARSVTRAVREAARVLAPGGLLVLIDTPLYETADGGESVVARRLVEQRERFGSDGAGTIGPCFLVRADLRRTFTLAGLRYQEIAVHGALRATTGGFRRRARRALHRPDLAIMPLVVGEKEGVSC